MNRLQLYISKSAREFKTLVDINGSSEGRNALADLRSLVAAVDYPQASKSLFYAVVNVRGGYMIHVLRTIPPTRPNHLDATIFVPAELDIMTEDLCEVIETVTDVVLAPAVTEDDMARLRELFAPEYDSRDRKPRVKPSSGSESAVMTYDNDAVDRTLADIVSDGLYRPEWSAYKAVLLLGEGLTARPGAFVDLDGGDADDADDEMPVKHNTEKQTEPLHKYVFALPMLTPDGRSSLEFEVESSRPVTRSPIPGYAIKGRLSENPDDVNNLRRTSTGDSVTVWYKLLWALAGFAACAIFMVVASWFSGCSDSVKNGEPADPAPVETPAPAKTDTKTKAPAQAPAEPTEASYYLDSHRVWRRDEMEKIDGLKGLYDDMNNFRFEQLKDEWAKKLSNSKNFARVAKAVRGAESKKADPRRSDEHNPCYNREGVTDISWLAYTYWIDP